MASRHHGGATRSTPRVSGASTDKAEDSIPVEDHREIAVEIGAPEDRPRRPVGHDRDRRRVPVVVAEPYPNERDLRMSGGDPSRRLLRRTMMGNLDDVDRAQHPGREHRILGRRVKTHAGEIDLVSLPVFGPVCFVEVKSRRLARDAAEAVAPAQRTRIARAASLYLASRPALSKRGMRFDIVTVAGFPKHYRDAWRPEDQF